MNHPSMFRVAGAPRRFVGETQVLISVWRDGTLWKADYCNLSKRRHQHGGIRDGPV